MGIGPVYAVNDATSGGDGLLHAVNDAADGGGDLLHAATFTREGRVVVKLVPEALVEAETVAQAAVGFDAGPSRPVGRTRQRAVGFPAWPIIADPGNARHALNLVGDLQWARRHAGTNPKKVEERFEGLAEGLRGSAPHFVPTLLEELARIFVAADREKHARRWFARARDIERAHGLPVDAARHVAAFLEFAANGVVGASELTREAGDAMERFDDPSEAFEHVLRLNCARIRAGRPPHANCARDLRKVGAAAGISADDADDRLFDAVVGMSAVDSASPGFWKITQTSLARWLRANPGRADHFVEVKADAWSLDEWIGFLEESGAWARLAADPVALRAWIREVVARGGFPLLAIVSPRFVAAIESLGTKLRGTRVPARFSHMAVDHVDVLTAAGVEWDGEPQMRFDRSLRWRDWVRSGVRTRTLETLLHDPGLADLVDDVVPSWVLGRDPDHFLATEGGRRAIGRKLREVADAHAANIFSPTTLAYLHEHQVRHLVDMRLAGVDPEAAAALRSYDPAETLAQAIRVGVLAELALPAVEESARRMMGPGTTEWWKGAGTVRVFDSYPRLVVVGGDRFAAVDGDSVVVEGRIPPGAGHVTAALTVGDELAFFNGAPGGWTNHVHWYRGPAAAMQDPYMSSAGVTVENAEGRITAGGLLTARDVTVPGLSFQKLACTADASRVFAHIDGAMREWLPARRAFSSEPVDVGAIPGILGIGPLPANDGITCCQAYPAQPDTVDGPAGSAGGLHFAIGYRLGNEWGATTPLGDFRAREPIASVVRRPGGGHWLMGAEMRLRNPDTGAYLAGRNGLLDGLPPSAVHRMRPRSPWVSELMRAFTRESAAELLSAMTGDSERGLDFRDVPADLKLSDVENRYSTERWRPSVDARPGTSAWETASRLLGTSDPLLLDAVIELAADAIELDRRVKVLLPAAERAAERFTVSAEALHLVGCLSGDLVVMGGSKEFAESLGAIADELASPGTTDGRNIDTSDTSGLVRHIGHERGFVALLAAPALDRALVREAVGLLRELVETGVLCSGWRAHLLEAPKGNRRPNMRKMRWEDDALFVGFMVDDAGAWRCHLARDDSRWAAEHVATTRATIGAGNADDDGMNADDFLADLAVLEERAAHPNHGASGSGVGEAMREAPWSVREKAAELAAATDLSEDAAAYLVGGIASRSSAHGALEEEQRERTDAVREALGMTTAAFTRARDRVRALPWATIRNMAIAGLPGGDVRRMAEEGPDVSAMAAVWARETGDVGIRLTEFERAAMRRPLASEVFVRYPDEVLDELLRPFDFKATDPDSVDHYVAPLLILASLRPPGDPVRPFIGEQLRAIAEQASACRERRVRYLFGVELGGDFEDIDGHPSLQTHRVLLEGHLDELLADLERDPEAADPTVAQSAAEQTAASGKAQPAAPASPAERGATPNPMDPVNSAPDTVAAAMELLGIDENAARYFLQILALADPSDANVRAWNGWRKKDIDAAADVLVDKGLLIEGRRAGAGRTRFLPGGWMEPGPGEKTMETWKAPLHLLWRDAKVRPVVPTSPPLVPLSSLYARAWERFAGGDVPGYGELATERYRGR